MDIVKLNGNDVIYLSREYIKVDGIVYTNPYNNPDFDKKAHGYKELIQEAFPTCNEDTQCVEMYYEETENNIYRKWRVRNLTEQEIAERERFNNMMKGE